VEGRCESRDGGEWKRICGFGIAESRARTFEGATYAADLFDLERKRNEAGGNGEGPGSAAATGVIADAESRGEFFRGAIDGVFDGAAAGCGDYLAADAEGTWGRVGGRGLG